MNRTAAAIASALIIGIALPGHSTLAKPHLQGHPTTLAPKAQWTAAWNLIGLTQDEFHSMGLDALRQDQANGLLSWMILNQATTSCGRPYPIVQKDELKYVHPYIEAENDANAAFVGELRSRIASIQDVRLAYSDSDADIVVGVLAMGAQDTMGRPIGHTASVVVLEPCVYTVPAGYSKGAFPYRKATDHFLRNGPDDASAISAIAATLDVSDFDPIRKMHADLLKAYEK